MKKSVALIIAVFAAWGALAQEPYRCKKPDGSFVIQDSPCKLSLGQPPAARPAAVNVQPATITAPPVSANQGQQQAATEKEKLAEMRIQREKREAQDSIANCEQMAEYLQASHNDVAAAPGVYRGSSLTGLAHAQLDQERKQTEMAGLQSQITAKRAECDRLRRDYERRYMR